MSQTACFYALEIGFVAICFPWIEETIVRWDETDEAELRDTLTRGTADRAAPGGGYCTSTP